MKTGEVYKYNPKEKSLNLVFAFHPFEQGKMIHANDFKKGLLFFVLGGCTLLEHLNPKETVTFLKEANFLNKTGTVLLYDNQKIFVYKSEQHLFEKVC